MRDSRAASSTHTSFLLGCVATGPIGLAPVLGMIALLTAILLADSIPTLVGPGEGRERSTDPIEELRDRYVRGEIDHEEFERRVDGALEGEGADGTPEGGTPEELRARSSR